MRPYSLLARKHDGMPSRKSAKNSGNDYMPYDTSIAPYTTLKTLSSL
jgi:hypothetical protein